MTRIQRIATLRALVVLVGAAALAFLLGEPHLEGRNAHATFFEVYFKDPFLAYAYVGSVPFFVALHRAFKALGYEPSSPATADALRTIRRCAFAVIGFVAGAAVFILLSGDEDRPAGLFMCLLAASGAGGGAAVAARLERTLQSSGDSRR